jgi:hypothetical protein
VDSTLAPQAHGLGLTSEGDTRTAALALESRFAASRWGWDTCTVCSVRYIPSSYSAFQKAGMGHGLHAPPVALVGADDVHAAEPELGEL